MAETLFWTPGSLTGESNCFALPIDENTYYDLFTNTIKHKIETPLDKYGLVDKTALAKLVLSTAPPEHYWGRGRRHHHWQWPNSIYPNLPEANVNPHTFRELSINKEWLPLSFERRLHLATIHPPIPEDDVMAQKIEAYQAANLLFRKAREIVNWQKQIRRQRFFNATDDFARAMNMPDKKRNRDFYKRKGHSFARGFKIHLRQYHEIPPEFRIVETGGSPEQVVVDIGRALGERALKQAMAMAA